MAETDEKLPMLAEAGDSPAVTPSEENYKPIDQMNGDEETSPPSNLQVTDLDSKSLDEGEEPSAAASAAVTEDEPDELQDEQKSSDERPEGRPAQLDISAANMNGDTEPPVSASPSAPVTPGGSDKPVKPPRMKSMRRGESPSLLHSKPADADSKPSAIDEDIESSAAAAAADRSADHNIDTDMEMKLLEPSPYNTTTMSASTPSAAVKRKKKFGLDYIMSNKWIVLGIVAVILVILIILIVGVTVSRKPSPTAPPTIKYPDPVAHSLKCGEVVGSWELDNSVAVFKGIPYSLPPVGDRRWKYSQPINDLTDCSNETNAKQFGAACFQSNPMLGTNVSYMGSEDCLYLNVWSPNYPANSTAFDDADLLPVLVYIHGGGSLQYGSGHDELLSPSAHLSKEINSVVVSFNYRLGIFGWLAVQDLVGKDQLSAGNFGLSDQINALKWIKTYIRQFGGNPDLITVAGLGSGGTSILALMANTEARTYFHRAWISGASSKFDGSKEDTYTSNTNTILRNLECKGVADVRSCLLSKSSEDLVNGVPWIQYPSWLSTELKTPPSKQVFVGGVMVNDGVYITQAPDITLEQSNSGIDIPLLIGNGEYETDMFQVVPHLEQWNWAQYSDYIRSKLDTIDPKYSEEALNYTFAHSLKQNTRKHMAKIVSDMRVICPQTFLAEKLSKGNNGYIFRYVMTDALPADLADKYQSGSRVATHGTDFAKLFHYSDLDSDIFKASKSRFRQLIHSFMVSGEMGEGQWAQSPAVYNISANNEQTNNDEWNPESCGVWKDLYPAYSWMN